MRISIAIMIASLLFVSTSYADDSKADSDKGCTKGRYSMLQDNATGYVYLLDTETGNVWYNETQNIGGAKNKIYWLPTEKIKKHNEMNGKD